MGSLGFQLLMTLVIEDNKLSESRMSVSLRFYSLMGLCWLSMSLYQTSRETTLPMPFKDDYPSLCPRCCTILVGFIKPYPTFINSPFINPSQLHSFGMTSVSYWAPVIGKYV